MGTNHGNHGKKGKSGRKSAYQELADAKYLGELWRKSRDIEEVKAQINSGKRSGELMWLSKMLEGNERFLSDLFKKLFPDQIDLSSTGKQEIILKVVYEKDGTDNQAEATASKAD